MGNTDENEKRTNHLSIICPSKSGERGIRTLGKVFTLRRFSKPFLSATQASLPVPFGVAKIVII
jgi:hypothetical protein